MVHLVRLLRYLRVQIVGFNWKLCESGPADKECGFRRSLLALTAHVTFAVIEKAFQQEKLTKGVAIILMNSRHEPYSENLTQGQTICLGMIVVKTFIERDINRNNCTTWQWLC